MKRLPILFISLFMALTMNAEPITRQQALQKAQQFMPNKTFDSRQMARKVLGKGSSTTTQSLYVFNAEGNGGFIVVSGDDSTETILGYATRGRYDEENLPENFRFWLEQRAAEIETYQRYIASNPSPTRNNVANKVAFHAAVDPLIITTWDQGNAANQTNSDGVYNIHLPKINGQYPCTGCVATAAAQIMYYYQWPQGLTGSVPGYTTIPESLANTSENLDPIQFQWDQMKTSYVFNDPNTEAVNAVADLMLYCGYAALMNYGINGSGAYANNVAEGMAEYFGYNPNTWKYILRGDYSISDWDQIIYNELANGRPVIYDGEYDGGHVFICDGYDGAGMYHFNWGWGGWGDGYFKLQAINPFSKNNIINMGFIADQGCIIGLQPSSWPDIVDVNANDTWLVPVIEGVVATAGNVTVEDTTVKMRFSNYNEDEYGFGFGIGILNNDGTVTPIDTSNKKYKETTLPSNYGFPNVTFDFSSYPLADSTYTLVPISIVNEETEWKQCKPADLNFEVKVSGEQREISVHPIENLIINEFKLAAGGTPDIFQYMKLNITNAGDNLKKNLYLFVGTAEDKGEFRNWQSISVAAGNTKEYRIFLGQMAAGTYTMWLTADYAGTQVLAKKEITITQDIRATNIEVIGDKEQNNILQVDVTVENHAGDYTLPFYLFASTTEKKEFVYAAGTAIESGSLETVSFYFQPEQGGTWNLWVTTDKDGNNVIGQTAVEVIEPSVVTVTNMSREYGESNPTFNYMVTGGALKGEPEITCEATDTSPVGEYAISIKKGSISNNNITLNPGTLTITKAPLTVATQYAERKEAKDNPNFVLEYNGWKNGEDESVLEETPVAATTATKESPAGEYPVTISGGKAQNYDFQYVEGMLVVTELEKGNLPLGYEETWTARLLFNSEGGYAGNYTNVESDIHGWSKLYEAQENDVYTISMPTKVSTPRNGRVQFKTPITIQANHSYKFQASLRADKPTSILLQLSENEDNNLTILSEELALEAGEEKKVVYDGLQGTGIQDMKLALSITTEEEYTEIELADIHLYDETEQRELWVGTSYYNYCYYRDEDSWTRIKDMKIEGRVETLSWTEADFDDSMWAEAPMPIGNSGYIPEVKTIWPGNENNNFWIRRDFELDEVKNSTAYYINVCHDDAYSIYVNGHLIDSQNNWTDGKNPITIEIPASYLQVGRNVIATYIQENWGGKFYDCGMTIVEDAYDEGDIGADIPASLIATEVNVANIDQTIDYSWNYGGWIELYNQSDKRISLRYLYISDDAADLKKFMLPDLGVIEPYGYKCIFFDHNATDGQFGDQATKQVPFKLNIDGGQIFLSEDGRKAFLTIDYPTAIARCSWAKKDLSHDDWGYNGDPTPEASNNMNTFADFRLNAPDVDTDSHLFTDPFDVRVDIPAGTTLRYTTDGTTPTLQNGIVSKDGLFHISETTSLRLRLFQNGFLPSQVITRSYIYQDQDYYLPVLAITTSPDNLYDNMIGVYVDGTNGVSGRNHGRSNINMDWERPVNFEYITPDGKMVINQEAEFIISGGWSRHYAPSSFKLKASKLYEGTTSFDYPFFRYKPFNKYKQLQIRNGGNDNNSQEHGRVRDAITQQVLISNGFYVDAQDYQPVHVFFNGEYIAQLNLREPNNRYNGAANYGYDDDEMDAFEYSNGYFQKAGTKDAFNEWLSLSKRAADDDVYNKLRQIADMDEVINFFAAISYIGCSDWICNNNNVKGYRSLPDGKFHLVLHDQDWGWNNSNGVSLINNNNGNEMLQIYNGMKQNPQFQRQFVNAYCLLGGSVFTPERCSSIGDSICRLVEPALAMEGKAPWVSFNEQRSNMISEWSRKARIDALRSSYQLGNGMEVRFSANIPQASFMLDNLPVPGNSFSGTLFAPVTLTASAPAGYRFKGWESIAEGNQAIISKKDTWTYYDQGSLDGENWKATNYSSATWKQGNAPLGYYTGGQRDYETILSYGNDANNKTITYYFRKTFTLNETPANDNTFTLNYTADDGFVVYINGVEVYRYLMPEGNIQYGTYATTYASGNPDSGSLKIDASYFRKGRNAIAVEVHNNVPGSTDIYWEASLERTSPGTFIVNESKQITLTQDENVTYKAIFEPVKETSYVSSGASPIRINEISANNSIYVNEYAKKDDWIELYNTTNQDIDIAGMYLSDNADQPAKYQITGGDGISTIVPAYGTRIIWASKREQLNQLHAPFKLENTDGNAVIIQAEDGSWADALYYNAQNDKQSFGRYPDGGNKTYLMNIPTIGRSNVLSTYDNFTIADLYENGESNRNEQEQEIIDKMLELTPDIAGQIISTEYFNLDGQKLSAPTKGVTFSKQIYSNGAVIVKKIMRK